MPAVVVKFADDCKQTVNDIVAKATYLGKPVIWMMRPRPMDISNGILNENKYAYYAKEGMAFSAKVIALTATAFLIITLAKVALCYSIYLTAAALLFSVARFTQVKGFVLNCRENFSNISSKVSSFFDNAKNCLTSAKKGVEEVVTENLPTDDKYKGLNSNNNLNNATPSSDDLEEDKKTV